MWPWSPVKRFERRLRRRERAAYLIRDNLRHERARDQNLTLARTAVDAARDDDAVYERLLGTPEPARLKALLAPTLLMWIRARELLETLAPQDLFAQKHRQLVDLLQSDLDDLATLTRLARIALHRPLTVGEERCVQDVSRRQT